MKISKKRLLRHLKEYSDEQIADAVRSGVVTIYELSHNAAGAFTPLRRKRVEAILSNPQSNSNDTDIQESEEQSAPDINSQEETRGNYDEPEDTVPSDVPPRMNDNIIKYDYDDAEDSTPVKVPPRMFRAPFSFKGRIRRKEYCLSYALCFIIQFILSMGMYPNNNENIIITCSVITLLLYIPMLWFSLAQGAKRCHDRNHSGWWQIIPFYILWLMFGQGDKGSNKYGDSPK